MVFDLRDARKDGQKSVTRDAVRRGVLLGVLTGEIKHDPFIVTLVKRINIWLIILSMLYR